MKKILLFLFSINSLAQAPAIEWQKTLGGSLDENSGYDLIQTSDNGYVIVGTTNSTNGDVTNNHGGNDYWIVKLNSSGGLQWQKTYGGSGNDSALSVTQCTDGGFVVMGYAFSNNGDVIGNHGGQDIWLMKFDIMGNLAWQKTLGGSNNDVGFRIQQTADNGFVVIARTYSTNGDVTANHGDADCWVVKLNSLGNIEWQKTFGGSNQDEALGVYQTSDGGYIFAGDTKSVDGDVPGYHGGYGSDIWVVKINALGDIQWQKVLGGTEHESCYSVTQTGDENYVILGYTGSNDGDVSGNHGSPGNGYDFWAIKLSVTGTMLWQKPLGGSSSEQGITVTPTSGNTCILSGFTLSSDGNVLNSHGGYDGWILKLDSDGVILWQKTLGGTNYDDAICTKPTTDGGYIVVGNTWSNDGDVTGYHARKDIWIVKLAPEQLEVPIFTNNNLKLYPNPADRFFNLKTANGDVINKIIIIDISGKIVLTQTQNTNHVVIENLSKGMYFVEAFSGKNKYLAKFIKQ